MDCQASPVNSAKHLTGIRYSLQTPWMSDSRQEIHDGDDSVQIRTTTDNGTQQVEERPRQRHKKMLHSTPRYGCCYLMLMMSFAASVCAAVAREQYQLLLHTDYNQTACNEEIHTLTCMRIMKTNCQCFLFLFVFCFFEENFEFSVWPI